MIKIRKMAESDIPLGCRLRDQAGWNQTPADWRRFLELDPDGCFVAESDGQAVATTTTAVFGAVGWIAMVLVEMSARHQGIGTRLVEHAVRYLQDRDVRTIRLDATALGRPVYERLGFIAEYSLARCQGLAHAAEMVPHHGVAPVEAQDIQRLMDLDQQVTGTPRGRLLERLIRDCPRLAGQVVVDGVLSGYVLARAGVHATLIGPAVALKQQAGESLLDWACRRAGSPVFIDIPLTNSAAMQWSRVRGLTVQREFTRMYLGFPLGDRLDCLWASSGPEKG